MKVHLKQKIQMKKECSGSINGDVHDEEFKENKRYGKRKLTFSDGSIYEGNFVNGIFHGKGKNTLTYESYYNDNWTNGKKMEKEN